MVCCSDLEQAVEDLSELLESPIEPDNIAILRQRVTDKTVRLGNLRFFSSSQCLSLTGIRSKTERNRAGGHRQWVPGREVEVGHTCARF
jgi:hypothetical protein